MSIILKTPAEGVNCGIHSVRDNLLGQSSKGPSDTQVTLGQKKEEESALICAPQV